MKTLSSILLIVAIALLHNSCVKDTGASLGMEDFENHPILWEQDFSIGFSGGKFILPVLDNEDNVYVLINSPEDDGYCDEDTSKIQIVSYDKAGSMRWKKEKWMVEVRSLLYHEGRVYCLLNGIEEVKDRLLIFDAENGNMLAETLFSQEMITMKISSERIYLVDYQHLYAYDLLGEEVWSREIEKGVSKISIQGDHVYISIYSTYNENYGINMYMDMGDFCEEIWSWKPNKTWFKDWKVIDLNNTLNYSYGSQLFFVSKESGQTLFVFDCTELNSFQGIVEGIGLLFFKKKALQLYDFHGGLLWEIENEHYYQDKNSISFIEDEVIYWGNIYGLYVANVSGEILWKLGINQNITNILEIVKNSAGDLICHSPVRGRILCIKGDH